MIRNLILTAACILAAAAPGTAAPKATLTLDRLLNSLASVETYDSPARFTVSMPQMPEDVSYDIQLFAQAAPADRFAPCSYLIDWQLDNADHPTKGFTAYFDGNHYRYNGMNRLQEYHAEWDSAPLDDHSTPERYSPGVQRSAQFVNLLPQFIAEDMRRWDADSTYTLSLNPDTIVNGVRRAAVTMRCVVRGETVREGEFIFNSSTLLPVSMTLENNPGSMSEQTVEVSYAASVAPRVAYEPLSEPALMARYPEEFEKYRESTFRVESLPGQWLPAFALPTLTGERYSRELRDPFVSPTAILIFDPSAGFAAEAIADLRAAAESLPYTPRLIFAAMSNNIDLIEEYLPNDMPDEVRLMSANGFARDCGVAEPPVVLIVDRSGHVSHVTVGYNKNWRSDVIQQMSLLKP